METGIKEAAVTPGTEVIHFSVQSADHLTVIYRLVPRVFLVEAPTWLYLLLCTLLFYKVSPEIREFPLC